MREGQGLQPTPLGGAGLGTGQMAFVTLKAPAAGSCKGSQLPPAEAAPISFQKAGEMKPLTSKDKDLTKEETCTEACLSVHMGVFLCKKCQH